VCAAHHTLLLTIKEHYIIHKLRYKINNILGNKLAYGLMKYGRVSEADKRLVCSMGGKAHHKKMRENNLLKYKERQRKSGIIGGNKALKAKLGFYTMSKADKKLARDKGRKTTVKNKLGMFSDEYREIHKKFLHKKIITNNVIFDSMKEAAKYHKVCCGTITYRVNSDYIKWKEWNYIKDGEK
jgi:hypothetical protein